LLSQYSIIGLEYPFKFSRFAAPFYSSINKRLSQKVFVTRRTLSRHKGHKE